MPEKDPNTYNLITMGIMSGAAILGGLTRWLQKFRNPAVQTAWTVLELFAHISMAMLSGYLAFIVAEYFAMRVSFIVGMISLASYFGGESVEFAKQLLFSMLRAKAGLPPETVTSQQQEVKP